MAAADDAAVHQQGDDDDDDVAGGVDVDGIQVAAGDGDEVVTAGVVEEEDHGSLQPRDDDEVAYDCVQVEAAGQPYAEVAEDSADSQGGPWELQHRDP